MLGVSWSEQERAEVNKIWSKVDALDETTIELKVQTKLLAERDEVMNSYMHEANGRLAEALRSVTGEIRGLSDAVLKIQVESGTKGHLVDRWIPMILGAISVALAAWVGMK